ncbi:beta-alanine-activating enzyme [Osmerus eperlanus]|uniref:beta-alanine-activating enzyme n=1 Tax=Osmerus eperlanus TaxID=29151 RepID=UPI002E0E26BC
METRTLQDMVTAAAAVNSSRIAVTFDSCMDARIPVSLLYSDVAEFSNDLTHLLREKQVTNRIALYCQTDVYLPVWILGILQVPAAYVPLDPEVPALLSAHIIDQCGLKYCVVQWDLLEQFQMAFSNFINVDVRAVWSTYNVTLVRLQNTVAEVQHGGGPEGTHEEMANADQSAQVSGVSQGELAYVLHTSGTTGHPKIVRVPHKCIVPNILHLSSLFQMTADDVVFLASPLTFDPSVVEMFLALSSGARLLMVPTVMKKKPNTLACALFKNHRTTFLQVTPTLLGRFGRTILQEVVFSKDSSLRVLALGGEACPSPGLLRSWRQEGNDTQIYNIYGITEVSCWACCYKLSETDLVANQDESSVPLGTPLMDTTVEVRDEHSCVVAEGEGQIFIGGTDRVCLLDDEVEAVPGTMRATGDWVQVKDSCLYFLGRQDRLIKRQGQRVHLDTLQQALMSVPLVEACAVGLSEDSRLVAFVVASSASGDQKATSAFTSVQHQANQRSSALVDSHGDLNPSDSHWQEELSTSTRGLRRAIRRSLSRLLPSPSVPDKVVVVPALPLTSHGKVDMGELMKIYQRQKATSDFLTPRDVVSLRKMLQSMWQDRLGLSEDAVVSDESNFLFSGGDSLQALGLCDDITTAIGGTSLGLLEIVLDGSFSDILHHAAKAMPTPSSEHKLKPHPTSEATKRQTDPLSSAPTKRGRLDGSSTSAAPRRPQGASSVVKATQFTVLRRAGEVIETPKENSDTGGNLTRKGDTLTAGVTSSQGTFNSNPLAAEHRETCGGGSSKAGVLGLRVRWASDTGRCVDASPVLLVHRRGEDASGRPTTTVFVGSHSHRMQALDLASGELLWERVLGDRIESSAAVCPREGLVVVGCYDGCVYFLCVDTGETKWTFQTGDAVKCSPTVDPLTGLVLVGSHDGHMYSLDPQARQCAWKRHCGGGAVFSSPCLHPSLRHLYAATLGGHLLCLHLDSGAVLWTRSRDTPFFSSPGCSSARVVVGSVDGNIYCFSLQGTELWRFTTSGPVFSSPCVTRDEAKVVCGSHDDHVYCLSCADGSLAWSFRASGRVYSSPCVFDGGATGALVALASADGTLWILDVEDGTVVGSLSLPGELFSSPVAWERSLVVGCRNNFVYCVEMTDGG